MSKFPRRRFSLASLRGAASASLLVASLIGFVGCSGGSKPFCCNNSKEKERLDNLERAQSADENADVESAPAPSKSNENEKEKDDETQEKKKDTTFAGLGDSDGSSGDAPTLADSNSLAQPVPVTASTEAVASNALQDAADAVDAAQTNANALVPAPELTPAPQTTQPANETKTPEPPTTQPANETTTPEAPTTQPEGALPVEEASAPVAEPSDEAPQPAPNVSDQPTEPETQAPSSETQKTVARAAWRNGSQRAASSRVARRATPQTLAVPETRGAATLSAEPKIANVVKVRAQATVPAVGSRVVDAARPEILPSLGAQTPSNVVKIQKRITIP